MVNYVIAFVYEYEKFLFKFEFYKYFLNRQNKKEIVIENCFLKNIQSVIMFLSIKLLNKMTSLIFGLLTILKKVCL